MLNSFFYLSIEAQTTRIFKAANLAISRYDNIIIMGDMNIDMHDSNSQGYQEME